MGGLATGMATRAQTTLIESCDTLRALMSVTPNLCCDKTKNQGTYTRMTSMVL